LYLAQLPTQGQPVPEEDKHSEMIENLTQGKICREGVTQYLKKTRILSGIKKVSVGIKRRQMVIFC